jgi:hypothetical protein
MKNSVYLSVVFFLTAFPLVVFSQVGINTDAPNMRAVPKGCKATRDQLDLTVRKV